MRDKMRYKDLCEKKLTDPVEVRPIFRESIKKGERFKPPEEEKTRKRVKDMKSEDSEEYISVPKTEKKTKKVHKAHKKKGRKK